MDRILVSCVVLFFSGEYFFCSNLLFWDVVVLSFDPIIFDEMKNTEYTLTLQAKLSEGCYAMFAISS